VCFPALSVSARSWSRARTGSAGPLQTAPAAGRSSDTSIFAALPLLEGYAPAVVWHMAKILECGAAAVAVRTAPDCMMAVLHEDSFDVFPLREDYRCTPQSVASHTLYENGPIHQRSLAGKADFLSAEAPKRAYGCGQNCADLKSRKPALARIPFLADLILDRPSR
jgi:hypothetical protein